jgi:catechol 2,3-dioxygenase-like lactoylglutathione lyase family enzyme
MMRLSVFKLFVNDQEEALRFYVDKLGFVVSEDNRLGDYRWLLVRPPGTLDVSINLDLPKNEQQRALVGQQGAGQPLFALATDDCRRDFAAMKARGVVFDGEPATMPYGTGVLLQDLYGNKLYLNEDPH